MKSLSKEKILKIHEQLINEFGGIHGVKNEGLLDSALNTHFASFNGKYLYSTTEDKITAITYSLISNHPMNDGNKRIGITVMLVLCIKNGINLDYTQQELIDLGLNIASGKEKREDILNWIMKHKR